MPPNVKEVANAIDNLDLGGSVLTKYTPLTAPPREEEQQHVDEQETEQVAASEDSKPLSAKGTLSPRDEIIARILREESIRKALTVDNIEAKLIEDAQRRAGEEKDDLNYEKGHETEIQGYWEEEDVALMKDENVFGIDHIEKMVEKEAIRLKRRAEEKEYIAAEEPCYRHDAYWEWDTTPKSKEDVRQDIINLILEEERIRVMLTAKAIENNMKAEANSSDMVKSEDPSDEAYWEWKVDDEHAGYWDWKAPKSMQLDKREMIEKILRDEEARKMVGTQHIEEGLIKDASRTNPKDTVVAAGGGDASYWDW